MKRKGLLTGKWVMLFGICCTLMIASANDVKALSKAPNVVLRIGDQHELGRARPPIPEGDAAVTQYVNFMIALSLGGSGHVTIGPHDILVTRSMNNFGPLLGPAATLAVRGTGTAIDLGTQGTYDYLFAHYSGPGGGTAEVWYVGDLSGVINIPNIGFRHGLSGWALFTARNGAVPDGGTTAMLLGMGFVALGMTRRFLKR